MTACARCLGAVVGGYCDRCGFAPTATTPPAADTRPSAWISVPEPSSRRFRAVGAGAAGRRNRVGGGAVEIAPMPAPDPLANLILEPSVAEDKRDCWRCQAPVGRSRSWRPARPDGFCESCGTHYDFAAKLAPGDLVSGQYEVAGALAHGGLGWVYLARDRYVSDRWCVLKGLLDTGDPAAADAAVAERQFLAEVNHPAIVRIISFVIHEGRGYIVMEYVGGPSLKQLADRRRAAGNGPLPVAEAAAYLLAVLPALGYLHDRGRVYCDFKPDNVIRVGDGVKLIDLGGVRRLDDPGGSVFRTLGYHAPELGKVGPTVDGDLYTVGRTLAVLTLHWPAWRHADHDRLPPRDDHDVLRRHDCLWRFLCRACAPDPADRFGDAAEMADALHGVMCQVAAAGDGRPRPSASARFLPPRPRVDGLDWRALPFPHLPDHPRFANRGAHLTEQDPEAAIRLADDDDELSWADCAAVVRAHCALGDHAAARAAVAQLDWRAAEVAGERAVVAAAHLYLTGLVAFAAGAHDQAIAAFDAAFAGVPGEPACALALAGALEASGDEARLDEAAVLYNHVAVTDPSWAAAVAGLARTLVALGRPHDAARVLTLVPDAHPNRVEALTLACRAMAEGWWDAGVARVVVDRLRTGRPGAPTRAESELSVALYRTALAAVERGEDIGTSLAGHETTAPGLARAAERALVALAETTPDPARRHTLLDEAARTRPWSLW